MTTPLGLMLLAVERSRHNLRLYDFDKPCHYRKRHGYGLQHHGTATHTRFIGMLADALMARLLPTLPAEGSRDNKVPRFDGNNLVWEILTGGGGGGLTEQQVTAIANARAEARYTDEEKTKLAAAVITSDLDPYGLGFIGIYPRYMRFDQLDENIIIAFGEIHEPYDQANRIEVSFNGVQVVRNEFSPTTKFFRFGIESVNATNIKNNTHRDAQHWSVQITFFKDGFLDNQVIGNIRTIPVIINRELEPPDITAIQSQLSRAVEWSTIDDDTAIPDNYIVRNGGRYFGAKIAHTKTSSHVTPPGDPTNWIELSNGTATFSAAQLARLLPTLPTAGSRDNKVPIFDGNTLGWEVLAASGLTTAQLARLLPTLPAEGSRATKIPRFVDDVLTWQAIDWEGVEARSDTFIRASAPSNSFGVNGNKWFNLSNGKGYIKQSGAWVEVTDFALESELSRATAWADIPNNTAIPIGYMVSHSNRYFGAKAAHTKASTSSAPTSDTTNWVELSNVATALADASVTLAKLAQEVKDSINAQASIGSYFDGLSDPLGEGWLSNVTGKWSATEHAWGVIGSPGASPNNDRNNPLYQSNEQIDWEKSFSFRYRLTFKRPAGASNQSGSFQTFWGGNAFTTVPSWIGALTEGMGFWCNRVRTQANVLDAAYDNYLFFGLLVPTTVTGNPARLFSRWLSTAPSHTTLYNGALRTSASSPARAIGTTFRDSNFGFFVPETDDECDINIVGFGAYVYLYVNNTLYARIDISDIGNLDFGPRFGWMGDATGVERRAGTTARGDCRFARSDQCSTKTKRLKMELLPTFPAAGSRDDKILRFAGDVLGWEDLAAASADGRVIWGTNARPSNSRGNVGDFYLRPGVAVGISMYEKTATSTWTYRGDLRLLPAFPVNG